MTQQAEALRLAEVFERFKESSHRWTDGRPIHLAAAAELRRLDALVQEQQNALKKNQIELVALDARRAAEKTRADQMTDQHRMQSALHSEARSQLAAATLPHLQVENAKPDGWLIDNQVGGGLSFQREKPSEWVTLAHSTTPVFFPATVGAMVSCAYASVGRIGLDVDAALRGQVNEQSPLGSGRLRAIAQRS